MLTELAYFGNARKVTVSASSYTLLVHTRCYELDEATLNKNYDVHLPDARRCKVGRPFFVVRHNTQSTGVATVKDSDGGTVCTLTNQGVLLILFDNTTAAGDWFPIVR